MEKKPKPETAKTKPINIMLPEELLERVEAFCAEQEMTIHEFVTDAIIEKLQLAHKENQGKVRL
jgi:metal-responsive CopG/Arc/MetJ family transcriptional regulator